MHIAALAAPPPKAKAQPANGVAKQVKAAHPAKAAGKAAAQPPPPTPKPGPPPPRASPKLAPLPRQGGIPTCYAALREASKRKKKNVIVALMTSYIGMNHDACKGREAEQSSCFQALFHDIIVLIMCLNMSNLQALHDSILTRADFKALRDQVVSTIMKKLKQTVT